MRWTALVLGSLAALTACGNSEPQTDWSLVGVYDASALVQTGLAGAEEEAAAGTAQYVWVPPSAMRKSCGPAKAPDGLGVFEAEIIANRLSPTLAIVLERNGEGDEPMTPADVRVSLGMEKPGTGVMEPVYLLQPAVMPRYVSVVIDGDAEARHKQVVRNQLRMELCMEHKTGRGWVGGDRTQLREAFLLDPPVLDRIEEGVRVRHALGEDRKYFGGQRDPVPALLGPPDACFQTDPEEPEEKTEDAGRGDGSLSLVPSDVWGASLRKCQEGVEVGKSRFRGMGPVPLTVGQTPDPANRKIESTWGELSTTLHHADDELDITVDLEWRDKVLLDGAPLFNQPVDEQGNPTGPPGITDLLEKVPHTYPLVGTSKDRHRYTVLFVPAWQIVEGLRRIDEKEPKVQRITAGDGTQDGVGWLIDNPEYLFVQLPPREGVDLGGGDASDGETWLNVAEPLAGGRLGLMRWGYSPGMLSGRAPVVLPGYEEPTWDQVQLSHNTGLHATFLAAFVLLIGLVFLGLQRLSDLWSNIPEERVDFWPTGDGSPPPEEDEEAPEIPAGGG